MNNLVIGNPTYPQNYFKNMDIGIKCYNSNVSIFNNKFEDIEPLGISKIQLSVAIYSTVGARLLSYATALNVGRNSKENEFVNCTNGVYSMGNQIVRIGRNTFDYPDNTYNKGTAIQLAELIYPVQPDSFKTVSQNTINNYQNGIVINNFRHILINENTITNVLAPNSSGQSQRSYGIKATGSTNTKITNNTIGNSSTGDWRIEGITFNNCPSSYVTCNTIEHAGKSIFAGGGSYPSIVQRNTFNAGVDGFFLNWGVIGPQGSTTNAQDNYWQGIFTDHQVVSYNSDGTQSKFYARSGNSYWPTDNVLLCPSGYNACDTIPFWASSGSSLALCYNPIPLPWNFKASFEDSVAQGLVHFTNDSLGSIWLLQQGLYKYLVLNDTIISDTIIQQFKTKSDTGNFGRFERVNAALLSGELQEALQINDSINDTEIPAVALKTVYGILINAISDSGVFHPTTKAPINDLGWDELDSNDVDTLISIAQQCPYYYGNAVYISRLILSFIDTTQYYNACEYPDGGQTQKVAHHSVTDSTEIDNFSVYPNPANNMITVTNPSGKPAIIEIYNYMGNKVYSYKIDKAVNLLSIKELSVGLYIYRITSENITINTNKLIIIK